MNPFNSNRNMKGGTENLIVDLRKQIANLEGVVGQKQAEIDYLKAKSLRDRKKRGTVNRKVAELMETAAMVKQQLHVVMKHLKKKGIRFERERVLVPENAQVSLDKHEVDPVRAEGESSRGLPHRKCKKVWSDLWVQHVSSRDVEQGIEERVPPPGQEPDRDPVPNPDPESDPESMDTDARSKSIPENETPQSLEGNGEQQEPEKHVYPIRVTTKPVRLVDEMTLQQNAYFQHKLSCQQKQLEEKQGEKQLTSMPSLTAVRQEHEEMDGRQDKKPKQKLFFCRCGRMHTTRSKLRSHVRYHTQEWKFSCHLCKGRFWAANHLVHHLLRSHNVALDMTSKVVGCTICGKMYGTHKALNQHRILQHQLGKSVVVATNTDRVDSDEEWGSPPMLSPYPNVAYDEQPCYTNSMTLKKPNCPNYRQCMYQYKRESDDEDDDMMDDDDEEGLMDV